MNVWQSELCCSFESMITGSVAKLGLTIWQKIQTIFILWVTTKNPRFVKKKTFWTMFNWTMSFPQRIHFNSNMFRTTLIPKTLSSKIILILNALKRTRILYLLFKIRNIEWTEILCWNSWCYACDEVSKNIFLKFLLFEVDHCSMRSLQETSGN